MADCARCSEVARDAQCCGGWRSFGDAEDYGGLLWSLVSEGQGRRERDKIVERQRWCSPDVVRIADCRLDLDSCDDGLLFGEVRRVTMKRMPLNCFAR